VGLAAHAAEMAQKQAGRHVKAAHRGWHGPVAALGGWKEGGKRLGVFGKRGKSERRSADTHDNDTTTIPGRLTWVGGFGGG